MPEGQDPDSYIRAHGARDYMQLLRDNVPWTEFLIARAQKNIGTRTPEQRVKALNFLLPHLRRIPNAMVRAEVAVNAAQKLGIDSSMVLKEVRQAAEHRLESVRAAQPQAVTEVERILLCALVLPEADSARALAAEKLGAHPHWFEDLPTAAILDVLVSGPPPENPLESAPDQASRALLASALHVSTEGKGAQHESSPLAVASALMTLHARYLDRRIRELRSLISEAERRKDSLMVPTAQSRETGSRPRTPCARPYRKGSRLNGPSCKRPHRYQCALPCGCEASTFGTPCKIRCGADRVARLRSGFPLSVDPETRRRLLFGFLSNWISRLAGVLIQLVQVPVFLHFWGKLLFGDWLLVSAIPVYLSFSNVGFGSVASNEMTMRMGREDQDGALAVFQSCWWLITGICSACHLTLCRRSLLCPGRSLAQAAADVRN